MNMNGTGGTDNDFDLDEILAEAKAFQKSADAPEDTQAVSKSWTQQDIDRLIAGTGTEPDDSDSVFDASDYSIYFQPEPEPEEPSEEPGPPPLKLYTAGGDEPAPQPADPFFAPDAKPVPIDDDEPDGESAAEPPQPETVIEPIIEPEPAETVIEPFIETPDETVTKPDIKPAAETAVPDGTQNEPISAPAYFDEDLAPLKSSDYLSGMETDEARKRFLNVFELEKTAEHDICDINDPIEKPGVILEKNRFSKTSDLEPMPVVIPAEDILRSAGGEEKTIINTGAQPVKSGAAKETDGVVEGQIILTGFESEDLQAESVSEETVETDLITRRREKAKNFKLVGIPQDGDLPYHPERGSDIFNDGKEDADGDGRAPAAGSKKLEYNFPEQRNRIYSFIKAECSRSSVRTAILLCVLLVYSAMMALPTLLNAASVESAAFSTDTAAYLITNFILLCVAAFACIPCIASGFKSLVKLKPDCNAGAALAVTFAGVQNLLVVFLHQSAGFSAVYSAAAAFALLLNAFGSKFSNAGTLDNFEFCAFKSPQDLYSIKEIENNAEAFEIGRGILMGNPSILYSCKTGFPSGFVENSKSVGLAEIFSRLQVPTTAGAALIIGLIAGLINQSFLAGFSVFTGAMCLAVPACALLSSGFSLRTANKNLNSVGAMISNQDSAEDCAKSNAVVIDSADLFDGSLCAMHGMREYKNFRIDDVILYTSAIIIKSGGPLTDIFDKVINGKRDLLPPVKSLSYEDRLGLTAWIHGQKVFLGNRSMLVNHNIEVPPKSDEDKYKHDGRKVMYLAIANKVAAMFVVSYAADSSLLPYIKNLENNGIQLLVRTCDSNITEDLLADCFDMQENYMKVIGATAGRIFKRYRDRVDETSPARVLHDGSSLSLLKSIAAAGSLSFRNRLAQILQTVSIGTGLLGLLILVCMQKADMAGALQIILFQAFWAVVTMAAVYLKKIK